MALVFAPVANVVMGAVRAEEQGLASAANNMIREIGGVLGIAVLVAIFSAAGGYGVGPGVRDGLVPGGLHRRRSCWRSARSPRCGFHESATTT